MTSTAAEGARFTSGPLPRVRQGVVVREEEGERFAVNLATGVIYDLNESGALIVEACRRGGTVEALVDELAARYAEVPRDELARDAAELLDALAREKLVEP